MFRSFFTIAFVIVFFYSSFSMVSSANSRMLKKYDSFTKKQVEEKEISDNIYLKLKGLEKFPPEIQHLKQISAEIKEIKNVTSQYKIEKKKPNLDYLFLELITESKKSMYMFIAFEKQSKKIVECCRVQG